MIPCWSVHCPSRPSPLVLTLLQICHCSFLSIFPGPFSYALYAVTPPSTLPSCYLSFYAFLISLVTPCCILISEELMLGSTDEEDHVAFVFLDLGHFIQYHSFVDLSVCLLFSFIFAAEYYHDCVYISYFHYPSLI